MDLNNLGVVGCQEVKIMQALARDGHPLCEQTEFLRMHKFKKKTMNDSLDRSEKRKNSFLNKRKKN